MKDNRENKYQTYVYNNTPNVIVIVAKMDYCHHTVNAYISIWVAAVTKLIGTKHGPILKAYSVEHAGVLFNKLIL